MTTKPNETTPLPATLKPGSFTLGSPESRAAARAMLNARETEGDTMEVHIELVGFGPDPNCACRACRQKWSKATPGERNAARLRLENYLDASGAASSAALPPSSPATGSNSQSSGLAVMPPRKVRPVVGAVGYLRGMR